MQFNLANIQFARSGILGHVMKFQKKSF